MCRQARAFTDSTWDLDTYRIDFMAYASLPKCTDSPDIAAGVNSTQIAI